MMNQGAFYTLPNGDIYQAQWQEFAGWFELENTKDENDYFIVAPNGHLVTITNGRSGWRVDDLTEVQSKQITPEMANRIIDIAFNHLSGNTEICDQIREAMPEAIWALNEMFISDDADVVNHFPDFYHIVHAHRQEASCPE